MTLKNHSDKFQLKSFEVVKGTTSRERGGSAYFPTYILDAVLLADHIKELSSMESAIKESLCCHLSYLICFVEPLLLGCFAQPQANCVVLVEVPSSETKIQL